MAIGKQARPTLKLVFLLDHHGAARCRHRFDFHQLIGEFRPVVDHHRHVVALRKETELPCGFRRGKHRVGQVLRDCVRHQRSIRLTLPLRAKHAVRLAIDKSPDSPAEVRLAIRCPSGRVPKVRPEDSSAKTPFHSPA